LLMYRATSIDFHLSFSHLLFVIREFKFEVQQVRCLSGRVFFAEGD
jgi:hypothetical protein